MQIAIFEYTFTCPNCEHSFRDTLKEIVGFSCCLRCEHEFEWTINIDY